MTIAFPHMMTSPPILHDVHARYTPHRIKRMIRFAHVGYTAFAILIPVNRRTLNRWLRGDSKPDPLAVQQLHRIETTLMPPEYWANDQPDA